MAYPCAPLEGGLRAVSARVVGLPATAPDRAEGTLGQVHFVRVVDVDSNHRPRGALPSAAQCSTDRPAGMRQTFALPVTRANAANSASTATASTDSCSVLSMTGPGSSSSSPHSRWA